MKRLATLLSVFLLCLLTSGLANAQTDGAFICISASSKAALMKGYGITIHITNTETGEKFVSQSLGPISRYAVIEKVPAGEYAVTFAEIPIGEGAWRNWSPELQDLFGTFEVEAGKAYYLGTYEATFEGKLDDRRFILSFKDNVVPQKLIKQLSKRHLPSEGFKSIKPWEKTMIFAEASF